MLEYHKNCTTILQALTDTLYEKTNEASMKPKAEFRPKTLDLDKYRELCLRLKLPDELSNVKSHILFIAKWECYHIF